MRFGRGYDSWTGGFGHGHEGMGGGGMGRRGMGHGPGHGRGMGRGGRGKRMFDSGELRLVVLALIAEQPRHGYDVIREIEERTGGAYAPSPGVVYPTITLLAEMDLIAEQESEGAKKIYGLTDAGAAHLKEQEEQVAALMERLRAIASVLARTDGGPVRRAMGNLRTVLQQRLSADVADETLHDVAEIIDEAARKIERL